MTTGTGTGEGQPQHDLLRGLALLTEAVDLLVGASAGWSLSDRQVHDVLVGLDTQAKRVEAARLALVRESVAREDGPHRGRQTRQLLVRRCHATAARAHADVANAALVGANGTLPRLGSALASGQVAREHLDVARRCLKQIPRHLVIRYGEAIDETLTQHARDWNPRDSAGLAEHLLNKVAPDTADRYDPEALSRRQLHTGFDSTGMLLVRGQLDPAAGAKFKALLERLADLNSPHGRADTSCGEQPGPAQSDPAQSDPAQSDTAPSDAAQSDPAQSDTAQSDTAQSDTAQSDAAESDPESGQPALSVPDLRTAGQRYADAFSRLVDLAAEQLALVGGDPDSLRTRAARAVPRIVVTTTPDQLAGARGAGAAALQGATGHGTLLDHATLTRLSCDAVIDRVVLAPTGRILEMTSLGRLATDAQTTALAARDGGCAWPGCTAPPCVCEAHHVTWWSRGGRTTIDNLTLLCSSHHTEIHTEQCQIQMRDGVPWFIPPVHVDPQQLRVRNTLRDAIHQAQQLGEQLRLGLDPPNASSRGHAAHEHRPWLEEHQRWPEQRQRWPE